MQNAFSSIKCLHLTILFDILMQTDFISHTTWKLELKLGLGLKKED